MTESLNETDEAASNGEEDMSANEIPEPSTETGKKFLDGSHRAASLAIAKAEELGYPLDEMLLTVEQKEDGGWHVALTPSSKVQTGGDITVEVSSDGEITDVSRWR